MANEYAYAVAVTHIDDDNNHDVVAIILHRNAQHDTEAIKEDWCERFKEDNDRHGCQLVRVYHEHDLWG